MNKKPARARTPREKFINYLQQMLHWQRLSRGTDEERAQAARAMHSWLEQGTHTGGKSPVQESATDEGQRIKDKRDGWKLRWREKIRGDAELTKLANEAGVLDKPRRGGRPGDPANPDPRVYKAIYPQPDAPKADELPPTIAPAAWDHFKNGK